MHELAERYWFVIGGVIVAALALHAMPRHPPEPQARLEAQAVARARFAAAADDLKITDANRQQLRAELAQAFTDLDRDLCDDSLRESVASIAVAYYETLLERPVVKAGLQVDRLGVCEPRNGASPPLTLRPTNARELRLPWDCFPESWRTPQDLALQARLEQSLRSGVLASNKLTGTLAVLSTMSFDSGYTMRCLAMRRTTTVSSGRTHLPAVGRWPESRR